MKTKFLAVLLAVFVGVSFFACKPTQSNQKETQNQQQSIQYQNEKINVTFSYPTNLILMKDLYSQEIDEQTQNELDEKGVETQKNQEQNEGNAYWYFENSIAKEFVNNINFNVFKSEFTQEAFKKQDVQKQIYDQTMLAVKNIFEQVEQVKPFKMKKFGNNDFMYYEITHWVNTKKVRAAQAMIVVEDKTYTFTLSALEGEFDSCVKDFEKMLSSFSKSDGTNTIKPMSTKTKPKAKPKTTIKPKTGETNMIEAKTKNKINVEIEIQRGTEKLGTIKAELYPDLAPKTVANFVKLIEKGFYDNTTFHRIIKGFMIQGGDPEGTGMGGPGYSIEGEFSQNGFENPLVHTKGVLSMARSQDPNSAGSQFFIMTDNSPHLDGAYAAFGRVVDEKSLEIVDKIVSTKTPSTELSSGKSQNEIVDENGKKVQVHQGNADMPLITCKIVKIKIAK